MFVRRCRRGQTNAPRQPDVHEACRRSHSVPAALRIRLAQHLRPGPTRFLDLAPRDLVAQATRSSSEGLNAARIGRVGCSKIVGSWWRLSVQLVDLQPSPRLVHALHTQSPHRELHWRRRADDRPFAATFALERFVHAFVRRIRADTINASSRAAFQRCLTGLDSTFGLRCSRARYGSSSPVDACSDGHSSPSAAAAAETCNAARSSRLRRRLKACTACHDAQIGGEQPSRSV